MTDSYDERTEILIREAQEGDQEAYDELFAAASERLHLYVQIRCGASLRRKEESLDLVQETYLAAHRAFDGFEFRGRGTFIGWLCQIAENCIRRRAEFHGAARRLPPEDVERVSQVFDRMRHQTAGPATRVEQQECRQKLAAGMLKLPKEEREVLLRRHFRGQTLDAIATDLDMNQSAVRRALARATVLLGADLAALGGAQ